MAHLPDPLPLGVALGVGGLDGLIAPHGSTNPILAHGHLLFDGTVLAVGILGAHRGWNQDIAYGMQCAAGALLASRLIPSISQKSITGPSTFAAVATPTVARGAVSSAPAGCSACAARA